MTQLSDKSIALVKATVPALEAHGLEIVTEMYARLFEHPHIRALFNQSNQSGNASQPRALTDAILAYARNIEDLSVMGSAVERIAQRHVGLQIHPDHYPYVADALLGAIKSLLGDAANDEIMAAWGEAYWFLANLLIGREHHIYDDQKNAVGGWNGWRDFSVDAVVRESSTIKSFVLRPADGGPVMIHKPGQYLTVCLPVPGHPPVRRNYSISAAPNGETYRISVKREPGGLGSGWLHDHVAPGSIIKVGAPAGEFYLLPDSDQPVVLLSGGVGLTPMIAMLESLVARGADFPIHYVHGTHNRDTHAMRDHVRALASRSKNVRVTDFHQSPLPDETAGEDYHHVGLITEDWLLLNTPAREADYYLCGPLPFLSAAVAALRRGGVSPDHIRYEIFGPADELLAA